MKKFILLIVGIFTTLMCLAWIFILFVLLYFADFQQGKMIIISMSALLIAILGWISFICYKSVLHKKERPHNNEINSVAEISMQSVVDTHSPDTAPPNLTPTPPVIAVNIVQQEVPQQVLHDMRVAYTGSQISNDMRIIDESLKIMEETSDIDTFLSRYKIAMTSVLTLEQAKKAGISIALPDNFSKSLVDAKGKALENVLYRSFQKELDEIKKLKTDNGKINRINKYKQKLESLYETEFEFIAENAYNDVMQKIEYLINGN